MRLVANGLDRLRLLLAMSRIKGCPMIGDTDRYLLGEGNHTDIYKYLGSHHREVNGTEGVSFAVWAPNASRVLSLIHI